MLKNYDLAVVFGGISNENEVSVITGTMVCNVLKKGGKTVLPVYIDREGVMRGGEELADVTIYKRGGYKKCAECALINCGAVFFNRSKPKKTVKISCGINCCHGGVYEGGAVAGAFNLNNLPVASAQLFESAAFMDKYYTKLVMKGLGVNTAKYVLCRSVEEGLSSVKKLGYPVIVKPVSLGSSIGVVRAENKDQLTAALQTAFELDYAALIEEYLSPAREINCAAYYAEDKVIVSALEEVTSDGDILSYDDKYSGGGRRVFPAEIESVYAKEISSVTQKVYSRLGMRGIVRIDYIISGGRVYLSEVNTVPGSLSQYLLSGSYKDFYGVLEKAISQAVSDFGKSRSKKVVSTGILNNVAPNACKLK